MRLVLRRRAVAQEAHAVFRRRLEQRSATFLEKLNAGGMTFLDTDIVRLLERDLPARFGGGPTDFSSSSRSARTDDLGWC